MLQLTRSQLIGRLRDLLQPMTDDAHSICEVAAKHGIFCQGFGRLDSSELRSKYKWLEDKAHRPLTRPELEERANTWELARQTYHGVDLACDAETIDHDHCKGWDGHSDEDLALFHLRLSDEAVEVVPE